MTKGEAIEKTKKHWQEMIEWVAKQPPDEMISDYKMQSGIKQNWEGSSCPLCLLYYDVDYIKISHCRRCPLFLKYGCCITSNDENLWGKVAYSDTWDEWLTNAKEFYKQLESLEE